MGYKWIRRRYSLDNMRHLTILSDSRYPKSKIVGAREIIKPAWQVHRGSTYSFIHLSDYVLSILGSPDAVLWGLIQQQSQYASTLLGLSFSSLDLDIPPFCSWGALRTIATSTTFDDSTSSYFKSRDEHSWHSQPWPVPEAHYSERLGKYVLPGVPLTT